MTVDSHGSRAGTSAPSRYQPASMFTAKECLSPWMVGRHRPVLCPSPAAAARRVKALWTAL